jgi:predicted 2-oxoglutarate/Fe(II)-dependent dioxygenase YbiX
MARLVPPIAEGGPRDRGRHRGERSGKGHPQANPATSVVCLPYLDARACDAVAAALEPRRWNRGLVADPRTGAGKGLGDVRRCRTQRLVDAALRTRLERDVRTLGEQHFGFALTGFATDDPVLVLRYEPGDHFAWHIDNGVDRGAAASRKLSFSLQLSAPDGYDGGDLQVSAYAQGYLGASLDAQRAALRVRGALIVFASFHLHRVVPVTRGTRLSVVGWLHGPAFR